MSISRRHVITGLVAAVGAPGLVQRALAAPGISGSEIVLGQSAVLSGPLGVPLGGFNAGARLAFDDLNRRGGLAGRQIRLVSIDDELKPDKAVANYKALLADHKVFAFFGGVGTGTTAAATPILRESNAPLIGNYAIGDAVREQATGAAYFVRASYGREAERLVELLAVIGMTRVAVAHLDNPGGKEVLASVRAAIAKNGGKDVVAFAAVKNDGSNAADAGKALAAAKPQAVIMFLAGPPTVELIKTMTADGSAPSFYGLSSVPSDGVAKALGDRMPSLSVAQVMHDPWAEAEPAAHGFREQCAAAKAVVNYNAFEGWVNAHVMIEGLRRSGQNPTRESLHAAMRSLKARVAGLDLDFTANSATGSRFVELVHVRADGSFLR